MKKRANWKQRGLYLIVSVLAVSVWEGGKAGTTAVPFLSMGVGARALVMGEAATATSSDAIAL